MQCNPYFAIKNFVVQDHEKLLHIVNILTIYYRVPNLKIMNIAL